MAGGIKTRIELNTPTTVNPKEPKIINSARRDIL
jgi:hypothetical protein